MKIKVFHWTEDEKNRINEKTYYAVTKADGNVTLTFRIPFRGNAIERSYTFNAEENKETVKDIFVAETSVHSDLMVIDAYTYCNRAGYNTNAPNRQKAARIIVDDKGDVFIMLTCVCEDLKGVENVGMEQMQNTATYYLRQHCSWFNALVTECNKKQALLEKTDPYASIAYLEAQIDLLTRIVLSLTTDESVKEYVTALQEADNYSVLNIKSLESVTAEFSKHKAGFRALQEKFYAKVKG